jgi:hypothetical protein
MLNDNTASGHTAVHLLFLKIFLIVIHLQSNNDYFTSPNNPT